MADWTAGDVVANGVRLHYYRTGGNRPPVVLAHGFTDDGLCWSRFARALESDFDVVMFDARGHGLSAEPGESYGVDDRAADLAGLIGALELDKPAVIGHSMGAETALYFLASYPDLVSRGVLEDPPIWPEDLSREPGANGDLDIARQIRARAESAKSVPREKLIAFCRKENPTWAEEELGPWADAKHRLSLSVFAAKPPSPLLSWREALARVTCPALLVTGDPEMGAIVTPTLAAEMKGILPSLEVTHLAGAGHNVRRERFDGFVEATRRFLLA